MEAKRITFAAVGVLMTLLLGACSGDDGTDGVAGSTGAPGADGAPGSNGTDGTDSNAAISLKLVGSTPAIADNFDESAAEIVAYHSDSKTAYLVNSNSKAVDVVDLSDVTAPTITSTLDVAGDVETAVDALSEGDLGAVNSVDVSGGSRAPTRGNGKSGTCEKNLLRS